MITSNRSTWFFSDPHFDHKNIIRYCNRPFWSVGEMNNTILRNWNDTVGKDDLVYFLGDMAFGRGSHSPRWWLNQLNGQIVYIKGSHDNGIRPTSEGLNAVEVVKGKTIRILGEDVLLIHSPDDIIGLPYRKRDWVIHGHVHNSKPIYYRTYGGNHRINVSAEVIRYRPISLNTIEYVMRNHK